jgi:ABC-type oligopeptide transport system substrate-binding subunit
MKSEEERFFDRQVADPGQLIGTGPFRVKDYQPDKMLVLERNHDYFRQGLPYVDAIEVYFIPDSSTRLAAFKSEKVDFFGLSLGTMLPPEEEQSLAEAGAILYDVPAPALALWFDTQSPPFDDDRVRQAVSLAVEPERWAQAMFGGWAPYQSAVPQVYFPQWGLSEPELDEFANVCWSPGESPVPGRSPKKSTLSLLKASSRVGSSGMKLMSTQSR